MEVFISWSGERSKACAKEFRSWVEDVIQICKPWISSHDIQAGSLWQSEILSHLEKSSVGIICVTMSNRESPWLLFEAGALGKGLAVNRVIPVLIDLTPSDVGTPLSLFQMIEFNKESMFNLIRTINVSLAEFKLNDQQLKRSFDRCWPDFEMGIKKAKEDNVESGAKPRTLDEKVDDLLAIQRRTVPFVADFSNEVELPMYKNGPTTAARRFLRRCPTLGPAEIADFLRESELGGYPAGVMVRELLRLGVPGSTLLQIDMPEQIRNYIAHFSPREPETGT